MEMYNDFLVSVIKKRTKPSTFYVKKGTFVLPEHIYLNKSQPLSDQRFFYARLTNFALNSFEIP